VVPQGDCEETDHMAEAKRVAFKPPEAAVPRFTTSFAQVRTFAARNVRFGIECKAVATQWKAMARCRDSGLVSGIEDHLGT